MPPEQADVIVALGGDGFMLETLHACIDRPVPIYGMNLGTVGFLLNDLPGGRSARSAWPRPTRRRSTRCACARPAADGEIEHGLGINEVSLFRETRQAANICASRSTA